PTQQTIAKNVGHNLKKSRISMKISLLIGILFCSTIFSCGNKNEEKFIFFLHNRFLETHDLNELHPEFGRTEYREIIKEFENSGFTVISEKRNGNVNARNYALEVIEQIDSLINHGAEPNKITVIGT